MKPIDLHAHTTASDGSLSPSGLVAYAAEKGLAAIAVTDHDTVAGLPEALEAGNRFGIEVVPGIETTVVVDGRDVHLVCLYMNPSHPAMAEQLLGMKRSRDERNREMVANLERAGLDIRWSDFERWEGRSIAKAHVAEVLIARGYATDLKDAIAKYMARGTVGYARRKTPEPAAFISAVHSAGGLAFIAHINQIDRDNWTRAEAICKEIIAAGADGLETVYSEYDEVWQNRALTILNEYDLLQSGGSDFHGSFKPGLDLGSGYGKLFVPSRFLSDIKNRLGRQ